MKRTPVIVVVLATSLLLAGCASPLVVQGTVTSYDADKGVMVVRDDLPPNQELEFDTTEAEFGAAPEVGDVVRIAYREEGGRRVAGRVMAVSRQGEPSSGKAGH